MVFITQKMAYCALTVGNAAKKIASCTDRIGIEPMTIGIASNSMAGEPLLFGGEAAMNDYIFFYGTLLPGLEPPRLTETLKVLSPQGEARVRGRLYDLGNYPGAILDSLCEREIVGHVFSLPESVIPTLDVYEDFDPDHPERSLFVRTRTSARLLSGSIVECWIYVFNGDVGQAPRIEDGDYARLSASRRQ